MISAKIPPSAGITAMEDGQGHDHCPYCGQAFEILCVKFGASGVRTVSRCPNCALAPTEPASRAAPSIGLAIRMLQTINSRFKIVVIFTLAAVLVAAVLRHTLHVYGGMAPADIRSNTLLFVLAVATVMVVVRFLRRRRN
jgi:predicted amidophosphoribosyltransferase